MWRLLSSPPRKRLKLFYITKAPGKPGAFCYRRAMLFQIKTPGFPGAFYLEQGTGVEPAFTAWEAVVLPIYEPCKAGILYQTPIGIASAISPQKSTGKVKLNALCYLALCTMHLSVQGGGEVAEGLLPAAVDRGLLCAKQLAKSVYRVEPGVHIQLFQHQMLFPGQGI